MIKIKVSSCLSWVIILILLATTISNILSFEKINKSDIWKLHRHLPSGDLSTIAQESPQPWAKSTFNSYHLLWKMGVNKIFTNDGRILHSYYLKTLAFTELIEVIGLQVALPDPEYLKEFPMKRLQFSKEGPTVSMWQSLQSSDYFLISNVKGHFIFPKIE